jgi:UDP-glucose 4-epimerase
MRILVTGGNGYVGRTLCRQLMVGHDVIVIDNLRSGAVRFEPDELQRIDFREADIRDTAAVERIMAKVRPDTVVHLAAIHFIPDCEADPSLAIGINVEGTSSLLSATPPGTRVVVASTAAVYAPEDTPHHEESSPVRPMDIYGLTKWQTEQYTRYWAGKRDLAATIVRLFNVIGPGETNPHILPAILAQALRGESRLRLGNCHPKRDYIDVTDVAGGFAAAALSPKQVGTDIVNLGTGSAWSVYEVVEVLGRVVGREFTIETDASRVRQSDRPFLAADNMRMSQTYGFLPKLSLEDALRRLWAEPDIPASLLEKS